jgi:hypothetical protein
VEADSFTKIFQAKVYIRRINDQIRMFQISPAKDRKAPSPETRKILDVDRGSSDHYIQTGFIHGSSHTIRLEEERNHVILILPD